MKKLYEKIAEKLAQINFNNIWNGFKRCRFALYDDSTVILGAQEFPVDGRFRGNTCIDFEGEYIAIWRVEDSDYQDIDLLAANVVHEMFHVYQRNNMDLDYPNDLKILSLDAGADYYLMKLTENLALCDSIRITDLKEKQKYINNLLAQRKQRSNAYEQLTLEEKKAEQLEGAAEFCGTMALKTLNPEKYQLRIQDYIKKISTPSTEFFDVRRMSYFTGTLLYVTLFDAGMKYDDASVYSLTEHMVLPGGTLEDNAELINSFERYENNKAKTISEAHVNLKTVTEGEFMICGYDPMNMFRSGNELYCKNFVLLTKDYCETTEFLQGPVVLKLKDGEYNIITAYLK